MKLDDIEKDAPFVVIENGKAEAYFKTGFRRAKKFFIYASIFSCQANVSLAGEKVFRENLEVYPVDFERDRIPRPN